MGREGKGKGKGGGTKKNDFSSIIENPLLVLNPFPEFPD